MKKLCSSLAQAALLVLLVAVTAMVDAAFAAPAAPEAAPEVTPGVESPSGRYVTIDFNDVDINLFIKYISELTGTNFLVDRAVKGNITIISPSRISEEDAYYVFESVLELHGFTTVEAGSIVKIVPSVQARAKAIETIWDASGRYPEDKVVTRIITLEHIDPESVKKIMAPLVSKTSVVIADTASGLLILTDALSNIERLMEIITAIDVPSVGEELEIMPLKHASAEAVSKSVTQLYAQVQARQPGAKPELFKIVAYERTNSLIVLASRANIEKVRDLMTKLDTEVPRGEGNIQVYYLQHANAEELVKVLTTLPQADAAAGQADQKAGNVKIQAPAISKDVKIMADPETNTLIVIAPRDEYLVLEDVIRKLDVPRRMVYIEALIMEVKVDKSFELGVQWGGGGSAQDDTAQVYTGFSGSPTDPYGVIHGMQESPPVLPAGFALGVLKQGIQIGDVLFPNLGAVLTAYKDDSDVNIIATPQILTTDNKKAEIKVGENVPYITSKNTTSGTTQDYTNYEYKDVSTTLEITPQINQQDIVRLEIFTEVIKLKDPNSISQTPTTLKRSATTTVVVHNKETVVIGGIIGQDTSSGEYKVPFLGDIPLLGWLFKTRSSYEARTNLFIFITPRIVQNPAELAEIYYRKRDVMEYVKPGSSEIINWKFEDTPRPEHAVALSDLGFAKLSVGDYNLAAQYFQQALKIDPVNRYALINLGVVKEHEGDKREAARLYREAIYLGGTEAAGDATDDSRSGHALSDIARDNLAKLGVETLPEEAPPPAADDTPAADDALGAATGDPAKD